MFRFFWDDPRTCIILNLYKWLISLMFQNQLSGYLLRKFKNSNGWQKLWVVFTNFCLFFFKTYQVLSFFMIPCIYLWTKNYRKQSFDIYIVYTQCKTSEIFREFEIEFFQIYCGHSIVTASNSWIRSWWSLYYFFQSQDDFPLASLPLLGYAVNTPEEEDGINKDHVFKLQFKNHVYFFRAESEYTFERFVIASSLLMSLILEALFIYLNQLIFACEKICDFHMELVNNECISRLNPIFHLFYLLFIWYNSAPWFVMSHFFLKVVVKQFTAYETLAAIM